MSYWRLYYHLVWATRGREPLIDAARGEVLRRSFRATCEEAGTVVHAIGLMPDHVHLAVSIPPRIAVATLVRQLKGSASHLLNRVAGPNGTAGFGWQAEYGVTSFGERSLSDAVAYVSNQAQRHAERNAWLAFEQPDRPYDPNNRETNPTATVLSPGGASSVERGPSAPRSARAENDRQPAP